MTTGKKLGPNSHDTISSFILTTLLMKTLLIFGVGLIGGSIALKVREKKLYGSIIGVARDGGTNLEHLVGSRMLDSVSNNLNEDIKNADFIIIATPVAQIGPILAKIYPYLSKNTLITDVGSTKLDVIHEARAHLKDKFNQFVGSHPIAGSEKHGAIVAQKDLFVNKNIIITNEKEANFNQTKLLSEFWGEMGGIVTIMSANEHDKIFSTVSHLPHLLAFNLVNLINNKKNKGTLLKFAASGFRDFSRIAASSPEMWRDISLANKEAILSDLSLFQNEIATLIKLIQLNDNQGLEDYLANASMTRKNWINN